MLTVQHVLYCMYLQTTFVRVHTVLYKKTEANFCLFHSSLCGVNQFLAKIAILLAQNFSLYTPIAICYCIGISVLSFNGNRQNHGYGVGEAALSQTP